MNDATTLFPGAETPDAKPKRKPKPDTEPTATERRQTMINAVDDFDAKFPAETATELVDRMIQARDEGAEHFKWDAHDASILFHKQPRTAVYFNQYDQVVIRQEDEFETDSDPFVFFDIDRLPRLIATLQSFYDYQTRK